MEYFFDFREDATLTLDDIGLEFETLEAAKVEAAQALFERGRDIVPGSTHRQLAVEVRNHQQALFTVRLTFEAVDLVS